MVRRRVGAIIVVMVTCVALFAPASFAGCVGPQIAVGETVPESGAPSPSPSPAVMERGQLVVVSGKYFHSGCEDTVAYGCLGPKAPSDPEAPLRGVVLTLQQGGNTWELATADAGDRTGHYAVTWQVRIPNGVATGAAILEAGTVSLDVTIS